MSLQRREFASGTRSGHQDYGHRSALALTAADNMQRMLSNSRASAMQAPSPEQLLGVQYPYGPVYLPRGYTNNVQLGLVTEHMLRKLDETRLLTMTELMRRSYGGMLPANATAPYIEEVTTPRDLKGFSPGNGDWRGQIDHIYAHLMAIAQEDKHFRKSIGQPRLGEITSAEMEEGHDSCTLSLTFAKPVEKSDVNRAAVRVKKSPISVRAKAKDETPEEANYERENYQQTGTLKPAKPFSAEEDCETLRKAMKGLGTDEAAIVAVFGKRTSKQRQDILRQFKTMFGKDLVNELKSELSGDFWQTIRALCYSPAEFDAAELNRAIKGLGTDDDCVIEIICTRSSESLKLIKSHYEKMFKKKLEDDIIGDTSGHYQRLLVSLLQANRDDSDVADLTLAKKEAKILADAGKNKWGTDESTFNKILVSRSFAQLRATFKEYQKLTGQSMEDAAAHELSGDLKKSMLTIVACVQNKAGYFAAKLYSSIKGAGTDDAALIRIVVTRCEIDMVQIKECFQKEFKQSLANFIRDDTSGDYQKLLLTLIGENADTKSK